MKFPNKTDTLYQGPWYFFIGATVYEPKLCLVSVKSIQGVKGKCINLCSNSSIQAAVQYINKTTIPRTHEAHEKHVSLKDIVWCLLNFTLQKLLIAPKVPSALFSFFLLETNLGWFWDRLLVFAGSATSPRPFLFALYLRLLEILLFEKPFVFDASLINYSSPSQI